jgi:hypothetical protein
MHREGRDQRHRDGDGRQQGGAPVAQEQQHHQYGQDRADDQRFHRGDVALLDIFHVRGDLLDLELGVLLVELLDGLADLLGGLDFRSAARADHAEGHHLLAVIASARAGFGPVVGDRAQVGQAHGAAARDGHAGFAQLLDRAGRAQGADGALGARYGHSAAGQVGVRGHQRLADRGGGDAARGQAVGIQGDLDLAIDAAAAVDLADAARGQQGAADVVIDEPAALLRRQGRSLDDVGDQIIARDVDPGDDRLLHVLGQGTAQVGHGVAHVVGDALVVHAQLELDDRGRGAVDDGGIGVAHLAQAGDRVLDQAGDLGFQLAGRGAGTHGRDHDDRQVDVGLVVDPHATEAHHAGEGQHHEQQDDGDRVLDRPGRDVAHGAVL